MYEHPIMISVFWAGTNLVDLSTKYWGTFLFPSVNLSNFTKFVGKKFANFLNKKLGREKKRKKKNLIRVRTSTSY
jgi:hypothetical protein